MGDLPLLMAGPIVRRVEPRLATVWLAISKAGRVRLHLFENGGVTTGAAPDQSGVGPAFVSGDWCEAVSCGARLWIVAVTAQLPPESGKLLRPGTLYSYNVEILFADGTSTDLAASGLLADEKAEDRPTNHVDTSAPLHLALGYDDHVLPTFATLPADTGAVRFAHTSCRKPHGPGYDALAWLDEVIKKSRSDTGERPAALFLTGDQIYADDVAACLLPVTNSLGHDLLGAAEGFHEVVPTGSGSIEGSLVNFPAQRRQKLMSTIAKFSSTHAASHLLTFAEFAAMYLLSWSPRVWRPLAIADEVFRDLATIGPDPGIRGSLTDWESTKDGVPGWRSRAQADFDEQTRNVEMFRRGVPHVARALANCATYMICDDHEVTDDWNLNGRWVARVTATSLGKWVIANGLMAYGAFQAWGNEPLSFRPLPAFGTTRTQQGNRCMVGFENAPSGAIDDHVSVRQPDNTTATGKVVAIDGNAVTIQFDGATTIAANVAVAVTITGNNADFLNAVTAYTGGPPGHDPGPSSRLAELCGLSAAAGVGRQARWHYAVTGGAYKFVVMDSRTRRKMPDVFYSPPSLLGDSLNDQIPTPDLGAEMLILISPSPVFNPQVIQRLMAPLSSAGFDAYTYCFKRIDDAHLPDPTDPSPRISGDEYFDAEGWGVNEAATESLLARLAPHKRIVILGGDVHYGYSMDLEYWRKGQPASDRFALFTSSPAHNGFQPMVEALVRQHAGLQRYIRGEAAERLYWADNPGIEVPASLKVSAARRMRLALKPTIIGAGGWPPAMTVPAQKQPDASWRLVLVRDQRTPAEAALPALHQDALLAELAAANALDVFADIVNRHGDAAQKQDDHTRQLVFACNIGLVRIEGLTGRPGQYRATHTLLSRRSPDDVGKVEGAENTVHVISLTPTGSPAVTVHA
jgi:hypothetical protein